MSQFFTSGGQSIGVSASASNEYKKKYKGIFLKPHLRTVGGEKTSQETTYPKEKNYKKKKNLSQI